MYPFDPDEIDTPVAPFNDTLDDDDETDNGPDDVEYDEPVTDDDDNDTVLDDDDNEAAPNDDNDTPPLFVVNDTLPTFDLRITGSDDDDDIYMPEPPFTLILLLLFILTVFCDDSKTSVAAVIDASLLYDDKITSPFVDSISNVGAQSILPPIHVGFDDVDPIHVSVIESYGDAIKLDDSDTPLSHNDDDTDIV
jgi:hypothetical protein